MKRRLTGYLSQSWQLEEQNTVMPLPDIDPQCHCHPAHNLDKILTVILQLHEFLIKTSAIAFVTLWPLFFFCEFILAYQSVVSVLNITIYSFSYSGHIWCSRYLLMLSVIKTIKNGCSICGMIIDREPQELQGNLSQNLFIHCKCHMDCCGIKPRPPLCEARY